MKRVIFGAFLTGVAVFLLLYDTQGLLPVLSHEFRSSPTITSLTISGPTLGLAFGFIPISHFASVYGRRKTMAISLLIASAIGILIAFSKFLWLIILLRTIEGVALAGVPAAMMAYLAEELPEERVASAIGIYLSGNATGGLGSRFISGWITQLTNWRVSLGLVAVIALIFALMFIVYVPQEKQSAPTHRSFLVTMTIAWTHFTTGYIRNMCFYGSAFMAVFGSCYTMLSYRLSASPYLLSTGVIGSFFLLYLVGPYLAPQAGMFTQRFGLIRLGFCTSLLCICGISIMLSSPLICIIIGLFLITCSFFLGNSIAASQISSYAADNKPQASALYLTCYYLSSGISGIIAAQAYIEAKWLGVSLVCFLATLISLIALLHIAQQIREHSQPKLKKRYSLENSDY